MARSEGASNHKLELIENIYVKFHVINPTSARSFVSTSKKLANKRATINSKNKGKCFLYAVGISVFSDELGNKNLERISKKLLKCREQLTILIFHQLLKILHKLKKITLIFLLLQFLNMVDFIK